MKALFLSLLISFASSISLAWIMPTKTLLTKTVETQMTAPASIESEATLQVDDQKISFKEKWLIEADGNSYLVLQGYPDQGNWKLAIRTQGSQRTLKLPTQDQNQKMDEPSFEKFFFSKKLESLTGLLHHLKIVPANVNAAKELPKTSKEITFESEPWARLSRAGGVPCILLSEESESASGTKPAVWIDQDQFAIRKIRMPSGATESIDELQTVGKGFLYPKDRSIAWGNRNLKLKTINVALTPKSSSIKSESSMVTPALDTHPLKEALLDFYMRSR